MPINYNFHAKTDVKLEVKAEESPEAEAGKDWEAEAEAVTGNGDDSSFATKSADFQWQNRSSRRKRRQ